jgi:O-antigen ligase
MQTILAPETDYNWIGHEEGGRMSVWSRGIGYMARRPLTGVGINAFPVAEGTISDIADRQSFGHGLKWSAAHNSFVQAGAELGVAGLFLFTGILFTSWKAARTLARDARTTPGVEPTIAPLAEVYAATIVAYAASGFFLSQAYGPFLYVVVGVIIGLDIASRRG